MFVTLLSNLCPHPASLPPPVYFLLSLPGCYIMRAGEPTYTHPPSAGPRDDCSKRSPLLELKRATKFKKKRKKNPCKTIQAFGRHKQRGMDCGKKEGLLELCGRGSLSTSVSSADYITIHYIFWNT